jgi:predicted restriction endonuclease
VRHDTLDLSPASQQQLSCYAAKAAAEKSLLQHYPLKKQTYKQRIDRYEASPDLTRYFRRLELANVELSKLEESRKADDAVKRERANKRREEDTDDEDELVLESETRGLLTTAAQQLVDAGVFNPNGIADARERVFSSISRRQGQPAFRRHLLVAYHGRCAFTGCNVEEVLDAAHIVPYRGPDTNHPTNGLLLRTDIHTLFDLNLVSVDVATMTILVSPKLAGTNYDQYRRRQISLPDCRESWPSREALDQHRRNSGL